MSQSSLFPEQVRVGVENRLLFDEHADLLKSLGFDIVPFGTDTVVVNGVPDGFSCEGGKAEAMVSDLLFILSEGCSSIASFPFRCININIFKNVHGHYSMRH